MTCGQQAIDEVLRAGQPACRNIVRLAFHRVLNKRAINVDEVGPGSIVNLNRPLLEQPLSIVESASQSRDLISSLFQLGVCRGKTRDHCFRERRL